MPALRAVRARFPEARIAIVARPYVADIYRGQKICDELISYDPKGTHAGLSGRERLIRELRAQKFDVALLLQNAFEAAWLAWRAGIPERIGYARDWRGPLLTKGVHVPQVGEASKHESHYYLELLRHSGWIEATPEVPPIRLHVTQAARAAAESALRRAGARDNSWRCAIAPGASYGAAKCWPPGRFAQLADRLISECGADVILFGTPNEKEMAA